MIKSVVIDDEDHNVMLLVDYIDQYFPLIDVVGTAHTKDDAIKLIDTFKPDLVFLDINLGNDTGFDVLEEITHRESKVIFVTSHSNYAIKAFDYNAIAYVVKPIEVDKLIFAVNKSLRDIKAKKYTSREQLVNLNTSLENKNLLDFIAVPTIGKIEFIKLEDIVFLTADSRYTTFTLKDGKKITSSKNLGEYEKIIDPNQFYRIHTKYLINLKYINKIYTDSGYYCDMITGDQLTVATRRQKPLLQFLNLK